MTATATTTRDAAFTPECRSAVLEASLHRCAGCGSTDSLQVHHRAPRGMGGRYDVEYGQPYNGLALCGRWCHSWAESNRDAARQLGWLTARPDPDAPYWTRTFGWCAWTLLTDPPCWAIRIAIDHAQPGRTPR